MGDVYLRKNKSLPPEELSIKELLLIHRDPLCEVCVCVRARTCVCFVCVYEYEADSLEWKETGLYEMSRIFVHVASHFTVSPPSPSLCLCLSVLHLSHAPARSLSRASLPPLSLPIYPSFPLPLSLSALSHAVYSLFLSLSVSASPSVSFTLSLSFSPPPFH
jgi:hypothetical protein